MEAATTDVILGGLRKRPNVPPAHADGRGWSLWIDGRWPLLILKTLGGMLEPIAALGRDRRTVTSSCGLHVTPCTGAFRVERSSVADQPVGNSVGAIGWRV